MMTYTLQRRLSHADVDFLGELKVAALLGLLEQAAVEASTAVGFDAARYTREGRIWIIRRTRLQRLIPVGGGDTVDVETNVVDFRRARSLRRYIVRREGQTVAEATTDWVYCDLRTGRPARIPGELERAFMGGEATRSLPRAASLPSDGLDRAVELSLTVQPSHLDHVTHVNNAVYASYLEDGAFALFAAHGWSLQRMLAANGALRVRWLDIEYLSDAEAGEMLTARSWLPDDATLLEGGDVRPGNAHLHQTLIRAHSHWIWRHRPAVVGGVPPA
jgi:acyl-CoA thioester hydrolase